MLVGCRHCTTTSTTTTNTRTGTGTRRTLRAGGRSCIFFCVGLLWLWTGVDPRRQCLSAEIAPPLLLLSSGGAREEDSADGSPPHIDLREHLDLSHRELTSLPPSLLAPLQRLKFLNLSHNPLQQIANNCIALTTLPSLEILVLDHCGIVEITDAALPATITDLFLRNNQLIGLNRTRCFASKRLQNLYLSGNQLSLIPNVFDENSTVKKLHLDHNAVTRIERDSFRHLEALEELSLFRNKLRRFPKDVFLPLKHLKTLDVSRNRIRRLEGLSFKGLVALATLRFERNGLSLIADGTFWGLSSLTELNMAHNRLTGIGRGWLYGLSSVEKLILSYNYVSQVDADGWQYCPHLAVLNLSHNNLRRLRTRMFFQLHNLQKFDLTYNRISQVDARAFESLKNLRTLDLSYNQLSEVLMAGQVIFDDLENLQVLKLNSNGIRSLPANVFRGLKRLTRIELENNPLVIFSEAALPADHSLGSLLLDSSELLCSCKIAWLVTAVKSGRNVEMTGHPRCRFPKQLSGTLLTELVADQLECEDSWFRPVIAEHPTSEVALQGQTVTFNCTATCDGCKLFFQWIKNSQVLYPDDSSGIGIMQHAYNHSVYVSTLTVEGADESDAASYQCQVANELMRTTSEKASLTVQIPPYFLKTPSDVDASVGSTVRLECAAAGSPTPALSWQKDGGDDDFPAASERRMHVMPTDDVFFIVNAKHQDAGVYTCVAKSAAGEIKADARLNITERKTSFFLTDKSVFVGQTAVFECGRATLDTVKLQNPQDVVQIAWKHNGLPLKSNGRRYITQNDRILVIVEVKPSDQGTYSCHHQGGTETARLIVQNVPDDALKRGTTVVSDSHDKLGVHASDFTSTIGIAIIAIVFCIVLTSLIWVCFIWRCRRSTSLVVAVRQDPSIELAAVANV